MVYNRIPVTFNQLPQITAPYINYQYDVVQMLVINGLELPDYYEVDFCNPGDSHTITIVGTADGVRIPDNLLLTGKDVIAYIVIQGIDEGAVETRYEVKIPVRNRPARSDIQPTPSERLEIDELVNALNDGVTRAEDAATEAESQADRAETAADDAQSAVEHYPKIEDGYWYVWLNDGWVNTGVKAEGVDGRGITSVTGVKSSTSGLVDTYTLTVTYTDGGTDTITFTVTNGRDGTDGTDGVSPGVTITDITGGHRVTITDKDHPTGQSFDVMDGEVSATDLKAVADSKAPVIIDTASGSIASFPDGADGMPVKSLVCQINPVQSGTGDPSPDNERPITGFTGLNLNRTARNILPISIVSGLTYNKSAGGEYEPPQATGKSWTQGTDRISYTTSSTYTNCSLITPLLPPGNYTYKATKLSAETLRMTAYALDKNFIVLEKDASSNLSDKQLTFTLQSSGYIAFYLDNGNTASQTLELQIQVEPGSTAHDYSPYVGETVSVDWQTEAGTVYGGYINLTTGVLTVDTYLYVYDGTETFSKSGTALNGFYNNLMSYVTRPHNWPSTIDYTGRQIISGDCSSMFKITGNVSTYRNNYGYCLLDSGHNFNCDPAIFGTTVDSFKAKLAEFYVAGTPVSVFCRISSPITIQLDPVTVSTLLGENNIWHDANGDVSVDYCADTKLYLEKLTQPTEDDMIANSAIESGKYFFVGNRLFLSTAAIANGATLTPGTNCVETNLAEALNALNS